MNGSSADYNAVTQQELINNINNTASNITYNLHNNNISQVCPVPVTVDVSYNTAV